VNPDQIIATETRKYHCYSCPLGCGGICAIDGRYKTYSKTHKPEYESVLALGGCASTRTGTACFTSTRS
jgi:aldehyde:ferredoxin oxidoreductase